MLYLLLNTSKIKLIILCCKFSKLISHSENHKVYLEKIVQNEDKINRQSNIPPFLTIISKVVVSNNSDFFRIEVYE